VSGKVTKMTATSNKMSELQASLTSPDYFRLSFTLTMKCHEGVAHDVAVDKLLDIRKRNAQELPDK